MKKTNLIKFLEQELPKFFPETEIELAWDPQSGVIELSGTIYIHNPKHVLTGDAYKVESAEEVLAFEDRIAFYLQSKEQPDPEKYLQMYALDKKGMDETRLLAILATFRDVLAGAEEQVLDFLADPAAEEFELSWDEEAFARYLKKYSRKAAILHPYPHY